MWFALVVLLAAAHYASFEIANTPLITDVRLYVYFAAQKAAGAVPYRDFFDIKTPLATFAGGFLIQAGELIGIDALTAIRVGYLVLAASVPVMYFVIHRQLDPGDSIPGILAACAFCGFPLLGFLPSVGNVPKLLVAFFAGVAFILVGRRRWILAGAAGGLAFLDWQIGILVVIAVMAGALFDGKRRIRSAGGAAIGAVSSITPFIFYFWSNGALGIAIHQIVVCARARGDSSSLQLDKNSIHIWSVVQRGCDGHEWLVIFAILGAVIFPFWARRNLKRKALSQVVALGVFHYGIVAYSLIDFQLFGDLFILLHSAAFFLGIAFIEIHRLFRDAISRCMALPWWPLRNSGLSSFMMCAVVFLITRPSVLRSDYSLDSSNNRPNPTLSDQREVNRALEPIIRDKRLAFVKYVEQLFLSDRKNDIPHAGWFPGNHFHEKSSSEESRTDTWIRLLRESCPEVVASAGKLQEDKRFMEIFERVRLASVNGSYQMDVYVVRESISYDRYAREFCVAHDNEKIIGANIDDRQ